MCTEWHNFKLYDLHDAITFRTRKKEKPYKKQVYRQLYQQLAFFTIHKINETMLHPTYKKCLYRCHKAILPSEKISCWSGSGVAAVLCTFPLPFNFLLRLKVTMTGIFCRRFMHVTLHSVQFPQKRSKLLASLYCKNSRLHCRNPIGWRCLFWIIFIPSSSLCRFTSAKSTLNFFISWNQIKIKLGHN